MRSGKTIYLDYQATTPVDPRVFDAMEPYLKTEFGNPHSDDHFMGWKSNKAVLDSQQKIAKFIGADANEVVFTSGATESNNLAILGLAAKSTTRKRILISSVEHKCVIEAANAAKQYGCLVQIIPVDNKGYIDLLTLEQAMDHDVLLVSIMAANNEIGTIQDLSKISDIVHSHGAYFHTDAAQLGLAMDIDISNSSVDMMSLSAHKIYGPKGIGALFLTSSIQDHLSPIIHGGGQQSGFRSGTIPTFLCVGFSKAADILMVGGATTERVKIAEYRNRFVKTLEEAAINFKVNGPAWPERHPANLSVSIPGLDAHNTIGSMQPFVCVSTGSACNSGNIENSYVLKAIGLGDDMAHSTFRFSFGRFTDNTQVDQAADIFIKAIKSFM